MPRIRSTVIYFELGLKIALTSIINYVDILKRSDIADEKILGYLDILEVFYE